MTHYEVHTTFHPYNPVEYRRSCIAAQHCCSYIHNGTSLFLYHTRTHDYSNSEPMHDQLSLDLLRNNPEKFIRLCQPIIEICVHQYQESGRFPYGKEEEDIFQAVNEHLLNSLESIKKQYNGRVLLRTYMGVVIKNICYHVYKKDYANKTKTIPLRPDHAVYEPDPTQVFLLEEELERFHTVLQLFPTERHKIYLGMKLFFKIPLLPQDVLRWKPDMKEKHYNLLMTTFGTTYGTMSMGNIFKTLAPVWNVVEHNRTSGAGIQRWINDRIQRIITLMNGNPPRRSYSKKLLQQLLSEEYARSLHNELNNQ